MTAEHIDASPQYLLFELAKAREERRVERGQHGIGHLPFPYAWHANRLVTSNAPSVIRPLRQSCELSHSRQSVSILRLMRMEAGGGCAH